MLIAILALAILFGSIAAIAALATGWSVLAALAVYSGVGLAGVLILILSMITMSSLQNRKTSQLGTDAIAGN